MRRTTKKEKSESEEPTDWRIEATSLISGAVSGIRAGLIQAVQEKVDQAKLYVVRQVVTLFFLLAGVLFLMIGAAHLLNQVFEGGSSLGFLLVGSSSVVLASMLHLVRK
jgi:hypothetical protein